MLLMSLKVFLSVIIVMAGLQVHAEASHGVDLSVLCKLRKEVRTLRIEKLSDGKCKTIYTKLGKDQDIGSAQSENSCTNILQKVRVNLEASAWKFREVKDSRVSNRIELVM